MTTEIKALSLWQPWASLIAIGAKQNETRDWKTEHRGVLAIHATAGIPSNYKDAVINMLKGGVFQETFAAAGYQKPVTLDSLPKGAIVALVRVVACIRMGPLTRAMVERDCGALELHFGDFADGRYAWAFADVLRLPVPVSCAGARQLWDVPADVVAGIQRQLIPISDTLPASIREAFGFAAPRLRRAEAVV